MSKRPAKTPTIKYMGMFTQQPLSVRQYVLYHTHEAMSIRNILARLFVILVSRRLLNAAELKYVVEGIWHPFTQFSEWTPETEHAEGKQQPAGILE